MSASQSNQEKIFARLEIFNREITQKINDESIDIDKLDVIEKTSEWVADQLSLLDILCNLILENLSLFTNRKEKDNVNEIVREKIIGDWENGSATTHLKEIQQSILDDERNQELLKLYVKILKIQERGGITIDDNQDRRKLLEVGIIREEKDGRVKVANPIYESVFNREWVYQNLPLLPVTSNQKVNNKDRATKQSKLFSQSILIAFLVVAVAYPISRLRSESTLQSSSTGTPSPQPSPTGIPSPQPSSTETPSPQPSSTGTPSPQSSSTGTPPPECMISKYNPKKRDRSALAYDARFPVEEYINKNASDLKEFGIDYSQSGCTVYVTISLSPNQTFENKYEGKLKEVIKNGVNSNATDKIEVIVRREIVP